MMNLKLKKNKIKFTAGKWANDNENIVLKLNFLPTRQPPHHIRHFSRLVSRALVWLRNSSFSATIPDETRRRNPLCSFDSSQL